jgi:2-amino-4-hydroxy-6-hydroxymethyldihydropteridine diphosphokinase
MCRTRRVVFGLGSNLGARKDIIRSAVQALRSLPWVGDMRASSLYETEPVGGPPQDKYINAAVMFYTDAPARTLLQAAMAIEQQHGRERLERFGPRTLDIDVLWIEDEQVGERD